MATCIISYLILSSMVIVSFVYTDEIQKPHFQVDHTAGKLEIEATKESADIKYGNDNIDLLLKPGDSVNPVTVVDKLHEASTKHEIPTNNTLKPHEANTKHDIPTNNTLTAEKPTKVDENSQTDKAKNKDELTTSQNDTILHKATSNAKVANITWKGRLNHTDERATTSVLKTLDEIKSLMSQSISNDKVTESSERRFVNTKEQPSGGKDDYLDAANAIIRKVEEQQGKEISKSSESDTDDTDYVARAQQILNRYKQIEKNNSTSKYIDEGISETMDKYDITGLTNNTPDSSSHIIHVPTQRDNELNNHTKNGLNDKNITIVPMKNQKISYQFNTLSGHSPRLLSNNQDKTKTQSDIDHHALVHASDNASNIKTSISNKTTKHDYGDPATKSDFNSETIATKSYSEEKNHQKENYNSNKDSKHSNDLDLSEKAERAYASIDMDPEAVRNALAEENTPVKYIEPKKNPKEEDIYATIDNNLTRNITKEELDNATSANLNDTKDHSKDWTKYVYHEKNDDKEKLKQHHLKKLVAWAPVKSANEKAVKSKEKTKTKVLRYKSRRKKLREDSKNADSAKNGNDHSKEIENEKANEFFKSQEMMESTGLCRGLSRCHKKSGNNTTLNTTQVSSTDKLLDEVKTEAKIENQETAEDEKTTQAALEHAKLLANDVARELNETVVQPSFNKSTATSRETSDVMQHNPKSEYSNTSSNETSKDDQQKTDVKNEISNENKHIEDDHQKTDVKNETLNENKHVEDNHQKTDVTNNQVEDTRQETKVLNKTVEIKNIKQEEADLTQEERKKLESDWSVESNSLKPNNQNKIENQTTNQNGSRKSNQMHGQIDEKDSPGSESQTERKDSNNWPNSSNEKAQNTKLINHKKELLDEKEHEEQPVNKNNTNDSNNEKPHNIPESYDTTKEPGKSVNSFVYNGEEKVEETYGSRDRYNERKINGEINNFSSGKDSEEEYRDSETAKKEETKSYKPQDLDGMITLEMQDDGKKKERKKKKKKKKKLKIKHKSIQSTLNAKKKKKNFTSKKFVNEKLRSSKKIKEAPQKKKDKLFDLSSKESSDAEQVLKSLEESSGIQNENKASIAPTKPLLVQQQNVQKVPIQPKQDHNPGSVTISAIVKDPKNIPEVANAQEPNPQQNEVPDIAPAVPLVPAAPSAVVVPPEHAIPSTTSVAPATPPVAPNPDPAAPAVPSQEPVSAAAPSPDPVSPGKPSETEIKVDEPKSQPKVESTNQMNETTADAFPEVASNKTSKLSEDLVKTKQEEFEFQQVDPPGFTTNHLDFGKPMPPLGNYPAEVRKELKEKKIDGPSPTNIEKLKKEASKLLAKPSGKKPQGKGNNFAQTENDVTATTKSSSEEKDQEGEKSKELKSKYTSNEIESKDDSANSLTNDVSKAMEELEALMKEKTDEVNKNTIAQKDEKSVEQQWKTVEHQTAVNVFKELNSDQGQSSLNFIDPKHIKPLEDDPIKSLALFKRNTTDETDPTDDYDASDETGLSKHIISKHKKGGGKFRNLILAEKKRLIPSEENIKEILDEGKSFKLAEELKLNSAKGMDNKKEEEMVERVLNRYTKASEFLKKRLREIKSKNKFEDSEMMSRKTNETSDDFFIKDNTSHETSSEYKTDEGSGQDENDSTTDHKGIKSTQSTSNKQSIELKTEKGSTGEQKTSEYTSDGTSTIEQQKLNERNEAKISDSRSESEQKAREEEGKSPNSEQTQYEQNGEKQNGTEGIKETSAESYNTDAKNKDENIRDENDTTEKGDKELNEVNKEIDSMNAEINRLASRKKHETHMKENSLSWKVDGMKEDTNNAAALQENNTAQHEISSEVQGENNTSIQQEYNAAQHENNATAQHETGETKSSEDVSNNTQVEQNSTITSFEQNSGEEKQKEIMKGDNSEKSLESDANAKNETQNALQNESKNETKLPENIKNEEEIKSDNQYSQRETNGSAQIQSESSTAKDTELNEEQSAQETVGKVQNTDQKENKTEGMTEEQSANIEPALNKEYNNGTESVQNNEDTKSQQIYKDHKENRDGNNESQHTNENENGPIEATHIADQHGDNDYHHSDSVKEHASASEQNTDTSEQKDTSQSEQQPNDNQTPETNQSQGLSSNVKYVEKKENNEDKNVSITEQEHNKEHTKLQTDDAKFQADDANLHADDAKFHADDANLHADDANLHADDAQPQTDDARPKAEDAKLQAIDTKLKADDAKLKADDARLHADDAKLQTDEGTGKSFYSKEKESSSPNDAKEREKNDVKDTPSLEENQQMMEVDKQASSIDQTDQSDQKIISQLIDGKQEQPSDLLKEIKADFDQQYQVNDEMKEYTQKERESAEKALEDMNRLAQGGDYIEHKEKTEKVKKLTDKAKEESKLQEQDLTYESELKLPKGLSTKEAKTKLETYESKISKANNEPSHHHETNESTNTGHHKSEQNNVEAEELEHHKGETLEATNNIKTYHNSDDSSHQNNVQTESSHHSNGYLLHPTQGIIPSKLDEQNSREDNDDRDKTSNHDNSNTKGKSKKNETKKESYLSNDEGNIQKGSSDEGDKSKTDSSNDGDKTKSHSEKESKSSKHEELLENFETLAKHFKNNDLEGLLSNATKNETSDELALEAATNAILSSNSLLDDMKTIDHKETNKINNNKDTQTFSPQNKSTTIDPYATFKRTLLKMKKSKISKKAG